MKMSYFGRRALVMLLVVIGASVSHAYDEDTHFYATYAMARYSGIRHEVAVKIALSTQWMDESFISDPMSMTLLPIGGVKKRRLLHFPSSRVTGAVGASAQQELLSGPLLKLANKIKERVKYEGDIDSLNLQTETEEGHPFATEMLMEGLKSGDLMKASASLHVLEDSFAHAGTPAGSGHAAFWHWPDRPFASVDKYFRMVRAVFPAIAAIRDQLPKEALDCKMLLSANPADRTPNCRKSGPELAFGYLTTPKVVDTVRFNPLEDPEYVRTALNEFFTKAIQVGYINLGPMQTLAFVNRLEINRQEDSYKVLSRVLFEMLSAQKQGRSKALNLNRIMSDMGTARDLLVGDFDSYINSFGTDDGDLMGLEESGLREFATMLTNQLLRWHVPSPMTDSHRMEFEDDSSPIRAKEVEIRCRMMRELIADFYKIDLHFVGSNSKDEVGFARELRRNKLAEPMIPQSTESVYATFTLVEKRRWDVMIFKYLFPSLQEDHLMSLLIVGEKLYQYKEKSKEIQTTSANWISETAREVMLTIKTLLGNAIELATGDDEVLADLKEIPELYARDLLTTRVKPAKDNLYYRNPQELEKYRQQGLLKTFLTDVDAWDVKGQPRVVVQKPSASSAGIKQK